MNKFTTFSVQKQNPHAPHTTVPARLLSHYRVFRDHEWEVVERSLSLLQTSGFYWGPLSVHEAHARLLQEPVGTYLLRDSSRGNCLFSVSVRMPSGPVSLRIPFQKGYFWLKDWFSDCVVRLLELVVAGTKANPLHCDETGDAPLVFSEPLCRECRVVPKLEELCQQALAASSGIGENAANSVTATAKMSSHLYCKKFLPGLEKVIKQQTGYTCLEIGCYGDAKKLS